MLVLTRHCAAAALLAFGLDAPALAIEPPAIVHGVAAAVRYDEPSGRYCVVVDTVARSRPPRPACTTPSGSQTIGLWVAR